MARVLHIQASPRDGLSASIAVADHFLNCYRASHAGDTIETLDLWREELPPFDGAAIAAKYAVMHGLKHTPEQRAAWDEVTRLADRFKTADKYLFSLPMWNFGIPYRLKHYIDLLVQPGLAFTVAPEGGYKGLITGRPAVAVYARGGAYAAGTGAAAYDLQSAYLRLILGFVGITDVREVFVEPTLASLKAQDEAIAVGKLRAEALAASF